MKIINHMVFFDSSGCLIYSLGIKLTNGKKKEIIFRSKNERRLWEEINVKP